MSYVSDVDRDHVHTWRGKWIWPQANDARPNTICLFRRTFELSQVPPRALLRITAETRYRLWINGAYIGEGSIPATPAFKYYDLRDVAEHLQPGVNCIAILARHLGQQDTIGGLLAELTDESGKVIVATDASWHCVEPGAWRRDTFKFNANYDPYQEFHDARLMAADWTEINFNDDWPAAQVITGGKGFDRPPVAGPWMRLVPRDIPFMEERLLPPAKVVRVDENLVAINRARSGDLSITLSMTGTTPTVHTRVYGPGRLCERDAEATIVQGSTDHLEDHTFNGIYEPAVLLDFGRIITANIEIDVEGPAGATIDGGMAEVLIDGQFNNSVEGQFAFRYTLRGGRQTFRTFTYRGFRFLKLRFGQCHEPVKVHAVRAAQFRYPFEQRGRFASNDDQLNRVFNLCRDTHRLCCVESIMDTPWRERAQWLGDVAAVTLGGIYACFGDTDLAGKFLRQSAAAQFPTGLINNMTNIPNNNWRNTIPDYSLWWIHGLYNHYLYTGDEAWLNEHWPVVTRIADAFAAHIDRDGLITDMPLWVFIDWANVDKRGRCAALNALLHGTLDIIAKIAAFKCDAYWRDRCATLRAGIAGAFERAFWDDTRGIFVDADVDGKQSAMVSEHTNAAAILWGLAGADQTQRVIDHLWVARCVEATEAQPFFGMVVLRALMAADRFDLAMQMVRDRWGKRIADRGFTSMPEEWTSHGSRRDGTFQPILRTQSHAWSAYPAEFLLRDLVGFAIEQPGCTRIHLNPRTVDFDYDITLPLPQGNARIRCAGGVTDVSVPSGVEMVC